MIAGWSKKRVLLFCNDGVQPGNNGASCQIVGREASFQKNRTQRKLADLVMPLVILSCGLLVILTTALHYEVLGGLNVGLPLLTIPKRTKLLVVIIAAFVAHAVEMAMYGVALYALNGYLGGRTLGGSASLSLSTFLFFSAETYTSLGFGDLTPIGPIRLLTGAEALNGLLLIGWSASFTYLSMERFWNTGSSARDPRNGGVKRSSANE